MDTVDRQLGEILVDRRLLTRDRLEEHLLTVASSGTPLPQILVEEGDVSDRDILASVAERLNVRFVDLDGPERIFPDPAALRKLSIDIAQELQVLPIEIDASGALVVAVDDPLDEKRAEIVRQAVGLNVTVALASRSLLQSSIGPAYEGLDVGASLDGNTEEAETRHEIQGQIVSDLGISPVVEERPHVNDLLRELVERGGSDLHLTAGSPPQVRINGSLYPVDGFGLLKPAPLRSMIYEILTGRQREELEESRELDASHPVPGIGRFRVNVFFQRDAVASVMRAIPNEVFSLEKLGMPEIVHEFATYQRGLVLVTGPTGSGKSTTLASIIDLINSSRADHIITVEDPIEFTHRHKMSVVNQREVGTDTMSFASALKHALRQDPDVILVGELRDLETISTAITAAETGHLVFATLHTQDAPKSIERIIDVFPPHQQQQVRVQLASSLQAVLSQQLLRTKSGEGRAAAIEVMVATSAIRNLIREGKVHQIASAMQAGGRFGMQTMDAALVELVRKGTVTEVVARERCQDPDVFDAIMQGAM
jgi:twitching motility protein PilT